MTTTTEPLHPDRSFMDGGPEPQERPTCRINGLADLLEREQRRVRLLEEHGGRLLAMVEEDPSCLTLTKVRAAAFRRVLYPGVEADR